MGSLPPPLPPQQHHQCWALSSFPSHHSLCRLSAVSKDLRVTHAHHYPSPPHNLHPMAAAEFAQASAPTNPSDAFTRAACVSPEAAAALQQALTQATSHFRRVPPPPPSSRINMPPPPPCSNGIALPYQSFCRSISSLEHMSGAFPNAWPVFVCMQLHPTPAHLLCIHIL